MLRPVLYELQQQLKEGYMRHVCNYTVRAVLVAALQSSDMGIEEATEKQEGRAAYCPPTVDDAPSLSPT